MVTVSVGGSSADLRSHDGFGEARGGGAFIFYGLWVVATGAGPVSLLAFPASPAARVAAVALILVHIASIPLWLKMQRLFLCSLSWAKEQDITPERLKLLKL